jgi:hypothetical protein
MPAGAISAGDVAYVALSVFLLASGLGLAYALVRLGGTLARMSSLIQGAERELLPVINKVGGTVDRVNAQLDKVDLVTDSAVDAAASADRAVRAVSFGVTKPVQKLTGLAAAISYGFADLRAHRNWREAVRVAKEAAARREAELEEELRAAGEAQ